MKDVFLRLYSDEGYENILFDFDRSDSSLIDVNTRVLNEFNIKCQ